MHTFPSTWKQSTIIPILKPGKPYDSPSSYRRISLTSCTSKFFERMFLGRLTYFLEQQDILSPVQAGFRPGRSTVDQVLLLSQSIQISSTNLNQAHVQSLPLWILRKFLTQFGILPFSLNSSLYIFLFALLNGYDPTSQIAVRKSVSVIHTVVLSVSKEKFPKVQF